VVDAVVVEVGFGTSGRQRRLVPRHETPGQLGLRLADRAADLVVELDGDVGDAAGRDVLGDVDLATTDDAAMLASERASWYCY